MVMRVAGLDLFPLKSAKGISLERAEVTARGLAGDRRWMIVDAAGRFVTQRELPALARLVAEPRLDGLRLRLDGEAVEVGHPPPAARHVPVALFGETLALPEAVDAAEWLTRRFGRPLRLVHQPTGVVRAVSERWGAAGDQVSLADGFPVLIASMTSLRALEASAGVPLGMARFRPNVTVEGSTPWAEDGWRRVRVGEVELELVKPCARCVVTTVDQDHRIVTGDEPLAALRGLRLSGDRRVPGVLFGWNAVPRRLGTVRVGDPVEVTATRAAWPVRSRHRPEEVTGGP